jgi:hypothetical protein
MSADCADGISQLRLMTKKPKRRSHLVIAGVVFALLLSLTMSSWTRQWSAFAQVVTGAPGAPQAPASLGSTQNNGGARPLSNLPPAAVAPPPAAAPGAPAAISSTTALPQLAPAPRIVQSAPPPPPQTFRCSCFGVGSSTRWIGVVVAASFTQADGAAQAQCVNHLLNSNEPSPYLPLNAGGFSTRTGYPPVNPNLPPGNVVSRTGTTAQTEISAAASGTLTVASYCQRCACN